MSSFSLLSSCSLVLIFTSIFSIIFTISLSLMYVVDGGEHGTFFPHPLSHMVSSESLMDVEGSEFFLLVGALVQGGGWRGLFPPDPSNFRPLRPILLWSTVVNVLHWIISSSSKFFLGLNHHQVMFPYRVFSCASQKAPPIHIWCQQHFMRICMWNKHHC